MVNDSFTDGVLQGSVLGSTQFLYINDLLKITKRVKYTQIKNKNIYFDQLESYNY